MLLLTIVYLAQCVAGWLKVCFGDTSILVDDHTSWLYAAASVVTSKLEKTALDRGRTDCISLTHDFDLEL